MENGAFKELPDITQLLKQRLSDKKVSSTPVPSGVKDPYTMMVKRNRVEKGLEEPELPPAQIWPQEDMDALQAYCQKMGILGFRCTMHPRLALQQLKQQCGDYSEIPLENRTPIGYQKLGTKAPSEKRLMYG
jgi:hypothetical protein